MTYLVRKAQLSDATGIADLLLNLGWFQHYFEAMPHEAIRARVSQQVSLNIVDQSHSVYVAEHPEGEIVGYVAIHWLPYLFLPGPEGFVSELFVRESTRGQGVGSRLLEVAKKEAIERNCYRLALINFRSRESYQRGFYGQRGWEERPDAAHFILRL